MVEIKVMVEIKHHPKSDVARLYAKRYMRGRR